MRQLFTAAFTFIACVTILAAPPAKSGPEVPPPAVEQFLKTWVLSQDVKGAAQFFDLPHVVRQWPTLGSEQTASDWLQRALTMWLIKDQGRVEALGNGDPRSTLWAQLPRTPEAIEPGERLRFENLRAAIKSVSSYDKTLDVEVLENKDFDRFNLADGTIYDISFQFRHAPTQALNIQFGQVLVIPPRRSTSVAPASRPYFFARSGFSQSTQTAKIEWKALSFAWLAR